MTHVWVDSGLLAEAVRRGGEKPTDDVEQATAVIWAGRKLAGLETLLRLDILARSLRHAARHALWRWECPTFRPRIGEGPAVEADRLRRLFKTYCRY